MSQLWTKEKYLAETQPTLPGAKHVSHSNLGATLETMVDTANHYYKVKNIAHITKNPVEWRYTNLSQYKALANARADLAAVTNTGRFIKRVKSDVDFSGSVKTAGGGRYICFDCKQFQGKSFPLANVEDHQIRTLADFAKCGAISGLLLLFTDLNRAFFVSAQLVDECAAAMLYKGARKSLSLLQCENDGIEIYSNAGIFDYLAAMSF